MKFVMLTYVSPERADEWDAMSSEQKQAYIDDHTDWFRTHGDRMTGGEELAYPPELYTIERRGGRPSISDGPFAETKEILGGVIFFEADTLEQAQEIAAAWPSLKDEGNKVLLSPAGSTTAD